MMKRLRHILLFLIGLVFVIDVCTEQCGKNEIPTSCFEAVCELRNCCDIGKPYSCVRPDTSFCTSGCLCKEGYLRDENGICIPAAQCPKLCGKNEIPTSCLESVCERRNCSEIGKPYSCVRLDTSFCTSGCLCKEGYLRDDNGVCVRISQCPRVCGKNEIPTSCFEGICERRSCSDLGKPVKCVRPSVCTDGCLCKEGYLRDEYGKCIPIAQCPNAQCGTNEIFDECPPPCPGEGCRVDPSVTLCLTNPLPGDPTCNPGCRCQDNYFRNDDGCCVTRDQCPVCGVNEVYDTCIAPCPPRRCDVDETLIRCESPPQPGDPSCNAGCRCADNFYRNDINVCVPRNECPGQCGENEIPTSCFEGICERRSCSDLGKPVICVRPSVCTNGCLCKEGYLRDEYGKCIPIAQCPNAQCSTNEIFDVCPPPCPGEGCRVDPSVTLCLTNPLPGDPTCNPGCRCQDNYFRNDDGLCVTRDQCPVCGVNEVYDTCIAPCPPRRCDVNETLIRCESPPQPGDPSCNAGCRCADNFYRNDINVCVPRNECPGECGENEIPTSCFEGICERRSCSDLGKPVICVRPSVCTNGCLCKEGYLRDEYGKCIPIAQCPNIQCGTNEIFDVCPPQCPGEDCRVDPSLILCVPNPLPGDPRCNPGCRCQDNYFRNDDGCCVTRDQCPKPPTAICGPDEVPTDCVNGGCGIWYCSQIQKICNLMLDEDCKPGCLCRDGLLRAENGTCIPADQCPPVCGFNEVYDTCIAPCPPRRCDVNETLIRCESPPQPGDPSCNAGCRCADNFFRNDINVCVPRNECPGEQPIICGPDEIYNSCINGGCDRRNCSQPEYTCVLVGEEGCRAGCQCRDGYLRADDGTCIPADQCPPLCGINEIYDTCPASCPPRTCATLGIAFNCITPLQPGDVGCKPGCRCIDGYYRNREGVCIPKNQCPKPVICGADEVYDSCVNGGCGRWNCSQPGEICIDLIKGGCREGCRCKEGLLRADDGTCIPADHCPINCFGQNEIRGCRLNCPPQTCESIGKKYCCPPQTKECREECRCKKGFFRNKIGECISKEDCLKCTGPNEYFSCGGACDNVCATLATQSQTNCSIVNVVCNPMCYCEQGYARDSNNTCVPISECPQPVCGKNEVFDICPATCPPRTCVALGRAYKCEAPPTPGDPECEPSCRCADGYYRNEQGACVSESECLNCGQNEVIGCQSTCPPQTCESFGKIYPCPLQPAVCRPECRCKEDFFRNKIGQCISQEDCLKCTGPNEYFSCGGACDNVCATLATQSQTNCSIVNVVCNPMCYCEQGYARDSNNTCVPISECPQPICGKNEIFDECPATCPPRTCVALGRAYKCEAPPKPGDPECKPSCRCADGYYRNKQGVCVPENECLNCFGQNEVIGCQNTCSPQTCESIGKRYNCPRQPAVCKPECRCKNDFFRNKIGQCISKEDCLKCTGPNEYFSCGGACDNVCATLATQSQTNCSIVNVVCNPMCYCEQGYARDSNNTCVPISKCPQPICGKNEVFDECPATCPPRTCVALGRDYKCKAPPKPGDPECKPSCRCADGYYRNKQDICVPKNKCPKPVVCGADEVYNSCVNGGCGRWNCSQPGIICIDLIKGGCREGCRCKEGLLRSDDGTCIPADQCPINCFGQNEIRGCRLNCPPQTCESIGKKYCCTPQTKECREECRCKEGFFRNKINECISKEDCLKCTGPNEYFSCGGACDNVCATLATQSQTNCSIVNVVCNPMCYCEQGYARDSNNTCIPISECPQPPTCGKNEVYDTCPPICPPQRCDFDPRVSLCAPNPKPGTPQCKPGCRCIDNYLRNSLNECIPMDQCDNNNTTNELEEFEQGNVVFTLKFMCEAANANPGKSLIFSPFSVLFLLAQLAFYATGTLLEQLLRILNLDTQPKIRNVIPNYLDTLGSQQNITLDLAAKTYANNKYPLSSGFKRDTREIFKAEAQNLDFCKPNEAADIINAWVEQQTNNLIKNLVQPSSLGCDTAIVLVNAIYFKGDWKYKFDPKNTRKQDFYVDKDKNVQVDMMSRTGTYKYAEINNLGAQVIQLPYESDNFSFLIYLPRDKDGINYLIGKLCAANFSFSNILEDLYPMKTELSMPAFNISTTTDLKEILIKNNASALFDPSIASFTGILENPQPLYVSSATQKATVIVNESGSIAAAANAITIRALAAAVPVDNIVFRADHPFIYFILYKGTPIFCGLYAGS